MVIRKSLKESYALISVFDKKNLSYLCKNLKKHHINFISTGSTSNKISKLGYKSTNISNLIKFKEILDGRVKTLHHKIHASLLFKRNNKQHILTFKKLNFPIIDFVIVNLYPFNKALRETKNKDKLTEMIDIGGSALLRSSAKNFDSITTICEPEDYKSFVNNLNSNEGKTSQEFRQKMALKVFKTTSHYDEIISKWFSKDILGLNKKLKKISLKYGENPNQKSYFIPDKTKNIFDKPLKIKKLGYNNILDISDGLKCLNEFSEPTCVIIKHNNPCGVASANSIKEAFLKAHKADSLSSYGGIVLLNRVVNKNLSNLITKHFLKLLLQKILIKLLKKI